jgi:hypothetical protein
MEFSTSVLQQNRASHSSCMAKHQALIDGRAILMRLTPDGTEIGLLTNVTVIEAGPHTISRHGRDLGRTQKTRLTIRPAVSFSPED